MDLAKLKEALRNPPPERLAKVEYLSYKMSLIGNIITCGLLIYFGFWYVIFAFIFSLGILWSQMITAKRKYEFIKEALGIKEEPEKYENDISYTRKRSKIITFIYGKWAKWYASIFSVMLSCLIINPLTSVWYLDILLIPLLFIFYFIIYFKIIYFFAKRKYNKRVKNDKRKAN